MLKVLRFLPLLFLLAVLPVTISAQPSEASIYVLNAEGTVNPVLVDYIERGIKQAEDNNARACIIQLNTPGGLLDSTEKIVIAIMNADIPIIVYVSPKGAWAASAGVFITLSAHIAVMTPGTTIGAAHPVSVGDEEISEEEMEKIVKFSANWMQTIADERGRNAEEAQLAVTQSKSFTDNEALEYNLIDLRAGTLDSLISQVDGWQINLANGSIVTLNTQDAVVEDIDMSAVERFLYALTDPNIAYILLSLAVLGITVEIFNPGLIFPGVTGAISGLFAFYSLGMLPVNYTGILLIALALVLFIAEAFTSTFGLLTAGGITSLVIGSLILFKGGSIFQVDIWLIVLVTIIFTAFLGFVITRIVAAHRLQATTGREELPGKVAVVRTTLAPEGTVLHEGEIWKAILDQGRAEPKEEVIIKRFDGLKLYVTKKEKGDS
ncbi:MAG TPA: nodulation protein NfeD [Dehalococcoidia bacterium]|nr:nodulation protein NfeD [Dehalococcoidia bacterium]